jgi:hypothetical protein
VEGRKCLFPTIFIDWFIDTLVWVFFFFFVAPAMEGTVFGHSSLETGGPPVFTSHLIFTELCRSPFCGSWEPAGMKGPECHPCKSNDFFQLWCLPLSSPWHCVFLSSRPGKAPWLTKVQNPPHGSHTLQVLCEWVLQLGSVLG